jgi:hypothetical protein
MFVSASMLNAQPSPASNVMDAIAHAKEAAEHGKAGYDDVGTEHAEVAVQHVSEGKRWACSRAQAGEHKILSRITDGGSIKGAAVHV